ncbi:MAG: hypothetical protein JW941_00545 [Candidatus Coatesbacteria bacterium]|nr:hypothetical protein [Candidatus Coatesbacteria bacterium]
MPNPSAGFVLAIFVLALCSAPCLGVEITTIDMHGAWAPNIALGPDGAIWLCPGDPPRILRISEGSIEDVQIDGPDTFEYEGPCHVAFAPDGVLWLAQNGSFPPPGMCHFYTFDARDGLSRAPIDADLSQEYCEAIFFDVDSELYAINYKWISRRDRISVMGSPELMPGMNYYRFWRLSGDSPEAIFSAMDVSPAVAFGNGCAWLGGYSVNIYTGEVLKGGLFKLNPENGDVLENYTSHDGISDEASSPRFFDEIGRLWLVSGSEVLAFDGSQFEHLAHLGGNNPSFSDLLAMAEDGTVWVCRDQAVYRYHGDQMGAYTGADGLPPGAIHDCTIDFDGNLWLMHDGEVLSRISYGGSPTTRLTLDSLETTDSIAIIANVFNTQQVVGIDVYIACQIEGSLVFYPNWTSEPAPTQLNLYAGFNETATIIEMPREQVPPGSYTFWGCMTGRNTQKLIGPIDRKFESVTVVR